MITFIPSGKKASKGWFAIKDCQLNKKKTLDTQLHLIETTIKHFALYACESQGDCDKRSKIKAELFRLSLCKQVLGVKKTNSNKQVLLGRPPFKIYIETQMFKYLQRLYFSEENT